MDYKELERRILKRLNVDAENLPDKLLFDPEQEYAITYCIVHALAEYDKMRQESNQKGDAATNV